MVLGVSAAPLSGSGVATNATGKVPATNCNTSRAPVGIANGVLVLALVTAVPPLPVIWPNGCNVPVCCSQILCIPARLSIY